jgi:hypothetical protein
VLDVVTEVEGLTSEALAAELVDRSLDLERSSLSSLQFSMTVFGGADTSLLSNVSWIPQCLQHNQEFGIRNLKLTCTLLSARIEIKRGCNQVRGWRRNSFRKSLADISSRLLSRQS